MEQKPREKMALFGPKELEDNELLAILLGKGSKRENVFDLCKRILKNFNREELTYLQDVKTFQEHFQMGFVQACQTIAAFELGKRFLLKEMHPNVLRSSEEVYERVKEMQTLKKEYVRGLYVNTRYKIIHDEVITIGSLDGNILHPREIFRPAIEYGAYALILVHNHPSGDPTPSKEDISVTQALIKIGTTLQIPLLDHIVVGNNTYISLNKAGFFVIS